MGRKPEYRKKREKNYRSAAIKTKISNLLHTTHFWNNLHQVHSKSKCWKTKSLKSVWEQ